jgi:iron complex outermembrane receptor protein
MLTTRKLHSLILATALLTPVASAENEQIENIFVTASRSAIEANTLPLSWAIVDFESLDTISHTHINEVLSRVSGAWISRGNGQEHLTALRSPVLTGAGGCGSIFMAEDGLSLRAAGFCNVNQLFDANSEQAERIEVLRGPAPSLYGSNAMHGVINIISQAPPEGTEHQVGLELGANNYSRLKYSYGTTSDNHGLRLNIQGSRDAGYKDNSGYGQQKLLLRHDYEEDDLSIETVFSASNLNQETAGFIQGDDAYKDSRLKDNNPNPEAYRDAHSWRLYSTINFQLDERKSFSIRPYIRENDMEFMQHFFPWKPIESNGHQSVGIQSNYRLSSANYKLLAGFDTEFTDGYLKELQANSFRPTLPQGPHYDYQVNALTAAPYLQFDGQLSQRLTISAGTRYEYTSYEYDNKLSDGSACAVGVSACRFTRPADREDNFNNWSINAALHFKLNQSSQIYTRVSSGFRAPQASELYRLQAGQQTADLDSEEISSVELGWRGSWNGLNYDMALYRMKKDNVIFQDSNRQNISNAETSHRGLELGFQYFLAENWELASNITYARHRYENQIAPRGSSGDIRGNDIDTAPRRFGSSRLSWDFSEDSRAELEWVYLGKYYTDPDNFHSYEGHDLLHLRVSHQLSVQLSASFRVSNITDKDYAERADFGFGNERYFVGEPRSVYLELRYNIR